MSVTVSVEATHRISRFEFATPHAPSGMVYGYGEVVLQEPATPSEGADMLRARGPMGLVNPTAEGEQITYGVMPGSQISRGIPAVMAETVNVNGTDISFETVLAAMDAFFEKWHTEDAENPASQNILTPLPPPAEMTPMPPLPPPMGPMPPEAPPPPE